MRKRNCQVIIRFTENEKEDLKKQAQLAGMNMGLYIRNLVKGNHIQERPADYWGEMIRQLSAIGNNINQIAHIANATEYIEADQLQETQRLMREVWKIVKEV